MYWQHRLSTLPIKLTDTLMLSADQTRNKHCSKFVIPFSPKRYPQDSLRKLKFLRSCTIIHQNEIVTNSTGIIPIYHRVAVQTVIPLSLYLYVLTVLEG